MFSVIKQMNKGKEKRKILGTKYTKEYEIWYINILLIKKIDHRKSFKHYKKKKDKLYHHIIRTNEKVLGKKTFFERHKQEQQKLDTRNQKRFGKMK